MMTSTTFSNRPTATRLLSRAAAHHPAARRRAAARPTAAPELLEPRRLLSATDLSATWDVTANAGSGPSDFGGAAFAPGAAPELVLDLGSGQVAVHSFSWGVSNLGSNSAGGGGAGKAVLSDLHVTADLGAATAGVFHAVSSGRHLPLIVLEGRDDEGGDLQFRYTLEDVLVSSASTGGSNNAAGPSASLTDTVSFSYAEVTFEHFDDQAGQPPKTRTASWNALTQTGSGPNEFGGLAFEPGAEPPFTLNLGTGAVEALSFSWGATQTGSTSTGGGAGGGKVNISDLNVLSRLGAASPALFHATAAGKHLPTVVLESRNAAGDTYLRYTLEDVMVSSYQTSGAAGSDAPVDSVSLDFAEIEVEQFEPGQGGAPEPLPTVEWNKKTNTGSGPSTFGGQTFPAGSEPDLLLDLGSGMIAIDAMSWGGTHPSTIGSGGGGAGTGKVNFQDFSFSAPRGPASPGLIHAVNTGRHVPQAVLVVRNPAGTVDARYTLEDVLVTSYQTSGQSGSNNESFTLNFASVELEQTRFAQDTLPDGTSSFEWDLVQNAGSGSDDFGTRTLPAGTTGLVLKLGDWELAADGFSWGLTNAGGTTSGGGTGAGKAVLGSLNVSAELGEVTPNLLYVMSSGRHLPAAALQQRDGQGRVVFEYALEDVFVSSYSTGGSSAPMPDSLSLDFGKVELTTTTRDDKGGVADTRAVAWDARVARGEGEVDFSNVAPPSGGPTPNQILIGGATLPVTSFSWGATNSGTFAGGTGGGAGKVSFGSLALGLPTGAATPSWLLATASGVHLPQGVLETRDAAGNVYLRYTLKDLLVSSFQTGGPSGGPAFNSVTLDFSSIELQQTTPGTQPPQVRTTEWDLRANAGSGQADFGNNVFDDGDKPPLMLQIDGDELAAGAFGFGAFNPGGSTTGGGGGAGKVSFSDLSVSGLAGTATAGLLYAVASGRHIPDVVLEIRDAGGDVVRTLALEDVIVTSHQLSGAGPETAESYSLHFRSVTVTTRGAPAPLEVTLTGPAGGPEGSPLHLDAAATSGDGPAAGGITFAWSVTRGGAAVASGTGDDIGFTPADDGTYLLNLTATAANGGTGAESRTIVVTNVAPTLSVFGAATVNERTPYSISFSAADPGTDTITKWTVDWGDGTAADLLAGTATSAGHQYAAGGRTYVITLTATDEDGTYAASRNVAVRTPQQAAEDIASRIDALANAGTLNGGNANALGAKLSAARKSLDANNRRSAAGHLGALINQLEAFAGKKLPASVAASLIEQARSLLALLA